MRYFYLTLSALFLFVACTRNTTPSLTRSDMLRNGKWTMSSATLAVKLPNGRDTNLNYLNFIPACHHDDYLTFNSTTDGAIHSNGTVCSPADPDSVSFQWSLSNNNNDISFFRGFSFVWSVTESILPFHFDTTQQTPFLVLDTLYGVNDTLPGYTPKIVIILDTFWNLQFDSSFVPTFDIYNASITSFSANAFTINYTMISTYPDSTSGHEGPPTDYPPIIRPDTFKYTVTYTNP